MLSSSSAARSFFGLQSHFRRFGRTSVIPYALLTDAAKQATSPEQPPYLNIKLPDLSAPPPEPKVYIPFTPDFWESSRARAAAAPAAPEEPQTPKVIVVAGDSARADSTHISKPVAVEHHLEAPSDPPVNVSNLRGLFHDIADDLVLPKDLSVLKGQPALLHDVIEGISRSPSAKKSKPFSSRTLDKDQVRGVWIILGLFAASWLAGGWFKKDSKYAESKS
ncbi:hypothetical protein F5148DRAFT_1205645 [Russula earlei]|uniref:Uncharacterized protein n=1 Tax=Russula earlei TaxID=71964 RepID=A0ACC0U6R1_9AGAM|nr:hypothetical protein F5148DRAFT_1205645 [Russula earlei]